MKRTLTFCRKYFSLFVFPIAFAAVPATAFSAENDYLPAGQEYDGTVPAPSAELGYELGEWHVRHDQLLAYLRKLADSSTRVQLTEIGKSYEERVLLELTISSPRNLQRLESIKARHRQRVSRGAPDDDGDDLPVLVSLNYGIHGNEPSSSNAALLVAYHLAAAQGRSIDDLLEKTVIVLNPSLNPDGLSLFTTWVNYHKSKNPVAYPLSREHMAIWPAGRMNHYLFNLNRDWLFLQQRETQQFVARTRDWLPQIFADFHETGTDTTAYFQPGAPGRVHPLTTERNQELTHKLAEFSAAAYDRHSLLYYTKERFDDFYHGKSSTYGDLIGSIGLTFEVGSSRGRLRDSINGPVGFPLTIKKQFITSLAVLEGARQLRAELLDYQKHYFDTARATASRGKTRSYIVGDNGDPKRLAELTRLLLRQGVDVYQVARRIEANGLEYLPGKAIVVPTEQASYRLIESLFERRTEFAEPIFYDISSWNAPMAFNLPFAALQGASGVLGEKLLSPLQQDEVSPPARSTYGYLFSWGDLHAPRALQQLLARGIGVRVAMRPLTIATDDGNRSFGRGSIFVPLQTQHDSGQSLHATIVDIVAKNKIEVLSVTGGLASAGIDLGSSNFVPLKAANPVLIAGAGISRSEVGEIWFLMDQRLDASLPIVDIANLPDIELDDFSHLILVEGDYESLDGFAERLKRWVQNGGTLIVQRGAAVWAQRRFASAAANTADTTSDDPLAGRPYASQEKDTRLKKIAGAILQAEIDATHPIGFGYEGGTVSLMRQGNHVLPFSTNPYSHPGVYADAPLGSGYVSRENLEKLRGTPAITTEKVGNGLIVSFADNPNFRAYFFGSSRLFLNTLFFSQTIDYID